MQVLFTNELSRLKFTHITALKLTYGTTQQIGRSHHGGRCCMCCMCSGYTLSMSAVQRGH